MLIDRLVAAKKKNPELKEYGRIAAGLAVVLEEQAKIVSALAATEIMSSMMRERGQLDELLEAARGYQTLLKEPATDGSAK